MKKIIFISLLIIGILHSSSQCKCFNKCNKCCGSSNGEFKLVPLYELFQPKTKLWFYTISLREMNDAIKNKGFVRKDLIGLTAVSSTDCNKGNSLIPINRYYDKGNNNYLFTTKIDTIDTTYEGIAFYATATANQCGAKIPLYRFVDENKQNIYATDEAEGKKRAGNNGINQGVVCYIWPAPNTSSTTATPPTTTSPTTTTTRYPLYNPGNCTVNLIKLFRLYRKSTDSYLITAEYKEAEAAYDAYDGKTGKDREPLYDVKPSPGYTYVKLSKNPECSCTVEEVFRVDRINENGDILDSILTKQEKEANDAVSKSGYTNKKTAFYCTKSESCGAKIAFRQYRRTNPVDNKVQHFYTTDEKEATGWEDEGVLCYIWPDQENRN